MKHKTPRSQRQRTHGMAGDYPPDWPEIARAVKEAAGWTCERCGHLHDVDAGYCLTVHHLTMQKDCCEPWNLAALCQRCHLSIQGRVDFEQGWMFDLPDWLRWRWEAFLKARFGVHSPNRE